ncbi:uncharacterized protein KY384_002495 [Bacidia gigantensis]|uniref:uncharacterized protein n=1 Tax=Bacidia gigantensis TaxID=2732470 RepID=UPI001D05A6FE|nr:uncharacterized protein KY384_002495 [Bacidia gigantensis]KAG8532618.1 hypothetical protein KY384_002495 [Bacidia gigantensis]
MAPAASLIADLGKCTQLQTSLDTCGYELSYKTSFRALETAFADEKVRRLRVQVYLLETEADNHREELGERDLKVDTMEFEIQELQDELVSATRHIEVAEHETRVQAREIDTLKTELSSVQTITLDSAKILTEKLSLAREISSLKPELEHLRSQASGYQTLLGEKLSLQRQLNILQVELENEKRVVQRNAFRENKMQEDDARLECQIQALQSTLNKERRERQKTERDTQNNCIEWESRVTTTESRLESLRDKLKNTKTHLKETQTELQQVRASAARPSVRSNGAAFNEIESKKRRAGKMDENSVIGTPGDLPAGKKTRRAPTAVGEKSTFSITPFLNRTASMAPDSPISPGLREDARQDRTTRHVDSDGDAAAPSRSNTQQEQGKARPGPPNSSSGVANKSNGVARRLNAAPLLEQVVEESNEEQRASCSDDCNPGPVRKAKRKILTGGPGKTLFDEDEGGTKGQRGVQALRRSKLGPRRNVTETNGFGVISPLKRDRKLDMN